MMNDDGLAHGQRRAALIEAHGRAAHATPTETAAVLDTLGVSVDASEVLVFLYRDQDAADAYAASNRAHGDLPSLGSAGLPDGRVAGVLDLRPALHPR